MADNDQQHHPRADDQRGEQLAHDDDRTLADKIMDEGDHQGGDRRRADRDDRSDHEPTQVFDQTRHEPTRAMETDQAGLAETRLEDERVAAAARAASDREDESRRRADAAAARQRTLGTVTPREDPEPVATGVQKRYTDRFLGSMGLFLLRLVTAAIMGVHGFQKLTDIEGTTAFLTDIGLPQPGILAWVSGVAELLIAVSLVFGFMVRVAGVGIAAIAIASLALVQWGANNPFVAGESGFVGELELLLAGVGVLFACIGGGGWGIDAGMRRGRARRRAGN